MESLKRRMGNGEAVVGTFIQLPNPEIVELAGVAGLDFVIVDNEHGPISLEMMGSFIRAAEAKKIHPIIRVADRDPVKIQKALDLGAEGIIVPQVKNREDAESIVSAALFAPEGKRGACPCVRSLEYGKTENPQLYSQANDKVLVILSLEGEEAVRNIEEIASVPGVDALILGPVDLSHSLGVPGEPDHPKVVSALKDMIERVKNINVHVGVFSFDPEAAGKWASCGARFLPINVDSTVILNAFSQLRVGFDRQKEVGNR